MNKKRDCNQCFTYLSKIVGNNPSDWLAMYLRLEVDALDGYKHLCINSCA